MRSKGFEQVYELDGGILSWRSEGLPESAAESAPDKAMSMADFQKLTQSENVLIDFYAPWCAPCKKMEPMLHELSAAYAGSVRIVRIDVDQNPGSPPVLVFPASRGCSCTAAAVFRGITPALSSSRCWKRN